MTGGGILPRGYIAAEFLENGPNQAYIITDFLADVDFGAKCSFEQPPTANGTTYLIGAYRPYFVAPRFTSASVITGGFSDAKVIRINGVTERSGRHISQLNYKNSKVLAVDEFELSLTELAGFSGDKKLGVFAYNDNSVAKLSIAGTRIFDISFSHKSDEIGHFIPAVSPQGEACFFDTITKTPFFSSTDSKFLVGFTLSQARNLSKLPVTENGKLTVSLPWESQWDTGVQNALSIAATKGWTIIVQYSDPEVATTPMPIDFLKFSQMLNTPYRVSDYLAPKELYLDAKIQRNDPNGGMWLSLLGYNNNELYIQRIAIAGFDYNAEQHNNWACHWIAPNNRGFRSYQDAADFSRRNKVLFKNTAVDINGEKFESPLNGTGSHEGGVVIFINCPSGYATVQLYRASYAENDVKFFDYVPCISSSGTAVLYNIVDGSELSNSYFIAGFDTVEQARKLAYLPDVTAETNETKKSLTVSLPAAAQDEATFVPAAIEVARQRGWTIIVQYRED